MSNPPPLVYIAGPITGDPFGCVRQAASHFDELRAARVAPFMPQLSVLHEMIAPQPYETWLAYDFDVIRNCAALVRLPGHSPGADREVDFANGWGIPVFHFDDVMSRDAFHRWAAEQVAVNAPCPVCGRTSEDPGHECAECHCERTTREREERAAQIVVESVTPAAALDTPEVVSAASGEPAPTNQETQHG